MKSKMNSVYLVNLEEGIVIEADPYVLRPQCIPHNYKMAEDVTLEEWVQALQNAYRKKYNKAD